MVAIIATAPLLFSFLTKNSLEKIKTKGNKFLEITNDASPKVREERYLQGKIRTERKTIIPTVLSLDIFCANIPQATAPKAKESNTKYIEILKSDTL